MKTATKEKKAPKEKVVKPAKTVVEDIRAELPVAVKGGTVHKPIWTIGDETYRFVQPLNKSGLDKTGLKPRLGKRILAKYKAGETAKGDDLMFVGVFAAAAAPEAPASESEES